MVLLCAVWLEVLEGMGVGWGQWQSCIEQVGLLIFFLSGI